MRQTFSHICKGYLQVRMQGYSPERFLNLCRANQIEIWELSFEKDGHHFKASLPDYRRVKPLVRKSGVRLKILGKYGLPFFYIETGSGSCLPPDLPPFSWCCLS